MQCLKPGISKNTHLNCIISNFCFILHSNINVYKVKEVCCPPPPALYSNDPTFHFLLSLDVSLLEAVVVDAAVVAAAAAVVVV